MATAPQQDDHADCGSTEWIAGYEAALADAIAIVDAMGGTSWVNLSAPVLLRLKTRLVELRADDDHAVA